MITISKIGKVRIDSGKRYVYCEMRGLSTDTKPTGTDTLPFPLGEVGKNQVENGSIFIEINTGKLYMYNLTGTTWSEM